ncbi:hypothetical protein MTO96_026847 [Rhipicephalus appendiculatus]
MKLPPDFPQKPPRLRYLTPEDTPHTHRNLQRSGKVCLSILGTSSEPLTWSGELSMTDVLLAVREMLQKQPRNRQARVKIMRLAVLKPVHASLNGDGRIPEIPRRIILRSFLDYYDVYRSSLMAITKGTAFGHRGQQI